MTTYFTTFVPSPIGPLGCIVDSTGAVVAIEFATSRHPERSMAVRLESRGERLVDDAERTAEVARQLDEYLQGRRRVFDLRLAPEGTPFQLAVWRQLGTIPFGETRSYGEIAAALGKPAASRAVGAANGANPIPIVVPCHRVIGQDGSLTGFGGGLDAKRWLLGHERIEHQVGLPFAAVG